MPSIRIPEEHWGKLDFRPRGSARFIAHLKHDLLHDFKQLDILIIESAIRVH